MDWELVRNVTTSAGALVAVALGVAKLHPHVATWWDRRTLKSRLGAQIYTVDEIERATAVYVPPDCQSVDPAGGEDFRKVVAVRAPLFRQMDEKLMSPGEHRFLILLADSGMGKTSFLVNYYARHWRSWLRRRRFKLQLVPLNHTDADELIAAIPKGERTDTVLFLDALDEDKPASNDHRKRLQDLLSLTKDFRSVVITSRTQFFPKDEEIVTETGVIKLTGPGDKQYYLHKMYLSPFTDAQVEQYLRRKFRWGRARNDAREVVRKIPDLVARPLLLTYVEDLTSAKGIQCAHQMYETVVEKWCKREQPLVAAKPLREFPERLAERLFLERRKREMERIPGDELEPLCQEFGIDLKNWQVRGRSLLNRDALGNYKFAHRSIMEYLFVRRFTAGVVAPNAEPWTDLMKTFLSEMMRSQDPLAVRLTGVCMTARDGLDYVWIPPGTYYRGSPPSDAEATRTRGPGIE